MHDVIKGAEAVHDDAVNVPAIGNKNHAPIDIQEAALDEHWAYASIYASCANEKDWVTAIHALRTTDDDGIDLAGPTRLDDDGAVEDNWN